MKTKKKLFLFFSLFAVFLLGANFAFALEVNYPEIFGLTITDSSTFPEYGKYFFNLGIYISVILAVLVIVFGGALYLISSLAPKFRGPGKEWVKSGVLGLILILGSYAIVNVINPDLLVFRLGGLKPIRFIVEKTGLIRILPATANYEEIPIGTLTENVLARAINCHSFDGNGDPIDGNLKTSDTLEPALSNHDRIDCFNKLAEAVERKSYIFTKLSEAIVNETQKCSCSTCEEDSKSAEWCSPNSKPFDENPGSCGDFIICDNPVGCRGPICSTCPAGVKEKIERGPVELLEQSSGYGDKQYRGLDEFRTQYPVGSKGTPPYPIEAENWLNNEKELIDRIVEKDVCQKEDGTSVSISNRNNFNDEDRNKCVDQGGQVLRVIKTGIWENLRLIDQLRYLKEKLKLINIRDDLELLKDAEEKLGACYLAKPYAEFLKIEEGTNKATTNIKKDKPFKDPVTGQDIDISRYCKGFDWQDSSFFHICKRAYPGITPASQSCFRNAPEDKLDACFNYQEFTDCLITSRDSCLNLCQETYPSKSGDLYQECVNKCNNNSKGFLEYTAQGSQKGGSVKVKQTGEQCYSSLKGFKDCAVKHPNDFFAFKNCAEESFQCKYASDQQAGFPDVLKPPHNLEGNYSSLHISQNPRQQLCPQCFGLINLPDGRQETCSAVYPQTAKGPSCSKCPSCPLLISSGQCGEFAYNDDPLTFYCQTNPPWWEDSKEKQEVPLGQEWFCSLADEIPVGQTVDEAEVWAEELSKLMEEFIQSAEEEIDYLLKIGRQRRGFDFRGEQRVKGGYGECDSYCNDDDKLAPPIGIIEPKEWSCEAKCEPSLQAVTIEVPIENDETPQPQPVLLVVYADFQITYINIEIFDHIFDYIYTGQKIAPGEAIGTLAPGFSSFNYSVRYPRTANRYQKDDIDNKITYCQEKTYLPFSSTDEQRTWSCSPGTEQQDNAPIVYSLSELEGEVIAVSPKPQGIFDSPSYVTIKHTVELFSYVQYETPPPSPGDTETQTKTQWVCSCVKQPCQGNPYQRIISFLRGERCSKNISYPGVRIYYYDIERNLESLKDFGVKERSEILKKLSYSRKKMDEGSVVYSGKKDLVKILSCERVKDEIIFPVAEKNIIIGTEKLERNCYGKETGQILNKGQLADNWFVCEKGGGD